MANKHPLLKATVYRFLSVSTTAVLVYVLTGDLKVTGTYALLNLIIKTALYYTYDEVWGRVWRRRRA